MSSSWCTLMVILLHTLTGRTDQQLDTTHPVRQTVYGHIRGYVYKRPNGREVERYLGVPFAAPPVGKLRFQRPVAPSSWKGVRDATNQPSACMQSWIDLHYIRDHNPDFDGRMTEDCLHVNIYVPVTSKRQANLEKPFPVLVHIHGGSNEAGMGSMLHGDVLASEGTMIVVTLNYRLGVLGFLSVPHLNIPGNYGLYDQTMALTWVQENIAFFGGDPVRVTVQGHSAGGADVGVHILSPISKGLFQYAILMSGSPTAYWAVIPSTDPKEESVGPNSHLKTLGCYFKDDVLQTWACLEKINASEIVNDYYDHGFAYYDFSPVVDGTFLLRDPKQGIADAVNAKSVMIGLVKDEGSLTVDIIMKNENEKDTTGSYMTEAQFVRDSHNHVQPPDFFNYSLLRQFSSPPTEPYISFSSMADWSYYMYKPWADPHNATAAMISFSDLIGDTTFTAPAVDIADKLSAITNLELFLYVFEHRSVSSNFPPWMGVPHGQDIFFLFGCPVDGHPRHNYTELDKKVSLGFIEMWSKFVYTGLATTEHAGYRVDKTFLRIASNETDLLITKGNYLRASHVGFWNELFPSLITHSTVVNKMSSDFRIWVLVALCLTLFALLVIAVVCLLHRRQDAQLDIGVTLSAEDDVGKIPML
ncbi:acetylcholinesterase-like [Biomphalaria glabrata]|uniref:Carboxylic ester hydrolase n=1 Tax=Biomphalaria glabrata TaxID=6526 RepID=A0A9W3AHU6_BIOGL|nr:acetylcholinesterase-like [Biomphalaria glabrata]XP_055886719.1 acetylcholinesterase-like [Biomphalaria glabrata]